MIWDGVGGGGKEKQAGMYSLYTDRLRGRIGQTSAWLMSSVPPLVTSLGIFV